jgi:hypothetical protein
MAINYSVYSAAAGGAIVNQVERGYNRPGQITNEWQALKGAMTVNTPRVQSGYTELDGGNHSRATGITYDAWNRLMKVGHDRGNTLAEYAYDGLTRRVLETENGTARALYYSDAWQVLEERIDGLPETQYVWSPVYVDAMIQRTRDTNGDGIWEETLYVQQDANFNVTSLVDLQGEVVERYSYTAFGVATVMDAAFTVRTATAHDWRYLHRGGRWSESTELYTFRFRNDSPTLGRWTTMDPIGYAAGESNLVSRDRITIGTDAYGLQVIMPRRGPESPLRTAPLTTQELQLLKKNTPEGKYLQREAVAKRKPLEDLSAMLKETASTKDAQDEADRIASAIINTFNKNKNKNKKNVIDGEKNGGHYCYEWAFAFEEAFDHESTKKYFKYRIEAAKGPFITGGLLGTKTHVWIVIESLQTNKKIYIDDGFMYVDGQVRKYVHTHMPDSYTAGYTYDKNTTDRVISGRDICNIPKAYDSKGKPAPKNPLFMKDDRIK